MTWISVKTQIPPVEKYVLLRYSKGGKSVVTQGYLHDDYSRMAKGVTDEDRLKKLRAIYGLVYYDYADRQIQSLTAKASKNEVTDWMIIPK